MDALKQEPDQEQKDNKPKSGYRNYANDPILAKDAYEFVKDLHGTLKKKRKPFELIWVECQDAFRCIEKKTFFQGTMPYCSSDLRDAALSIIPKLAKAIWYIDTPFDLVPVGAEGDDDQLSEINQKVLEWDFRNLNIYLKYVDSMFQKGIFGTTIVKTPPHWEMITKNLRQWNEIKMGGQNSQPGIKELSRKKTQERMFMGTDFVVCDLLDFWIDPAATQRGIKDVIEYSDCIESIEVRQTDLEAGKKSGIYLNLEKIENSYIGAKKGNSDDSSQKQRMKAAGHMVTEEAFGTRAATMKRGNKSYEIKECFADFDLGNGVETCLIVVGADQACIRLQPWECDKPYLSSRYTPNGYNREFYGTGIIETNLSNHYERNATRKQILTARTMGLNMEMLSDQTGFTNKPDKLRTAPNKVHWVKNINGVKPFEKPIGQILQSGVAWETNLKAETQQSTGNTPYIQGSDTSKINDTASGITALTQAGNERFTLPLQLDEAGMLQPFVKRSLQNNVDYRTESFVIRLTDKKPIRVEPDDLSANFDVYAKGSSELQDKQRRQQGLMQAWQISLQAAQIEQMIYGAPLTKFSDLKKEIYANLGLSQPERFLIDPKELQGQAPQTLTPDMEWILLRRMADGSAPLMPILIHPGEDVRDHYEKHMAKRATEEFQTFPPQVQQIWDAHCMAYRKVLNYLESKKKEEAKTKEIETEEVAVNA